MQFKDYQNLKVDQSKHYFVLIRNTRVAKDKKGWVYRKFGYLFKGKRHLVITNGLKQYKVHYSKINKVYGNNRNNKPLIVKEWRKQEAYSKQASLI